MGTEPLTVYQAEVTTASVEIQTLTVRGKQVTLAFFRQLVSESIIDYDYPLSLKGEAWGTVNYHSADCRWARPEHIHVIWKCGQELRRADLVHPEHMEHFTYSGKSYAEGQGWEPLPPNPFVGEHQYFSSEDEREQHDIDLRRYREISNVEVNRNLHEWEHFGSTYERVWVALSELQQIYIAV